MTAITENSLGIWLVRSESEALAVCLQRRLAVDGELATLYRPWLTPHTPQQQQFGAAYRQHRQWVMLAASGIVVRFLDGLMRDKRSDPAVVALDEAGRHAVALLAGHEGGANQLAYRVANAVGAAPVISTATETLKPLVLGIGCRKNVSEERIAAAVAYALGERALTEVREVATVDLKANEPGLLAFCARHGLPLRVLAHATVAARPWTRHPSHWVQHNVGLDGVCEPCALISCPRGQLIVPKTALNGVAVAIVEDKWMEIA